MYYAPAQIPKSSVSSSQTWLRLLGLFVCLWGAANTYLDIVRYGADWGMYFWFCNLALFGIGIGMMLLSRGLILAFISIASFTQSLWLLDCVWKLVTHTELFGIVHYLYQPGLPLDEFVLAQYHFFTMTLGFLALCFIPRQGVHHLVYISIFNPLIFAISYFAFPASQNINSIHQAYFDSLSHWNTPIYSIGFWAVIFVLHLVISKFIDRLFRIGTWSQVTKAVALSSCESLLVIGLGFSLWNIQYKLTLPSLDCAQHVSNTSVNLSCRHASYVDDKTLMLTYRAKNNSVHQSQCAAMATIEGKEQILTSAMLIEAQATMEMSAVIPTPTTHAILNFRTECKELAL